jgi:hypothetical protein
MTTAQELARLDSMIASKLKKAETAMRETRVLVRQRERLLSDTAEEADTDAHEAEARSPAHAHAV